MHDELCYCYRYLGLCQATRAAQFEKEDLLKNYRGLHAEKRRLEAGMDDLQLARQRLTKVCLCNEGRNITWNRNCCTTKLFRGKTAWNRYRICLLHVVKRFIDYTCLAIYFLEVVRNIFIGLFLLIAVDVLG